MFDQDLKCAPIAMLAEQCRRETERFRKQQASNEQFCLEIFRRALEYIANPEAYHDYSEAWEALVAQYNDYIRACLQRTAFAALQIADTEEVVQLVWIRFWEASRRGLSFDHLPKALTYLHLIVTSEVIDKLRQRKDSQDISIEDQVSHGNEVALSIAPSPQQIIEQRRFDARCLEILTHPQERTIFVLQRMGYKPKEIADSFRKQGQQLNDREPTPRVISTALERIFDRLKHDHEIMLLLESG